MSSFAQLNVTIENVLALSIGCGRSAIREQADGNCSKSPNFPNRVGTGNRANHSPINSVKTGNVLVRNSSMPLQFLLQLDIVALANCVELAGSFFDRFCVSHAATAVKTKTQIFLQLL